MRGSRRCSSSTKASISPTSPRFRSSTARTAVLRSAAITGRSSSSRGTATSRWCCLRRPGARTPTGDACSATRATTSRASTAGRSPSRDGARRGAGTGEAAMSSIEGSRRPSQRRLQPDSSHGLRTRRSDTTPSSSRHSPTQDARRRRLSRSTYPEEGIGIARAAKSAGIPVVVGFTVETDGRLPSGHSIEEAIVTVDNATDGAAEFFVINCAHPTHFADALPEGDSRTRIRGLRANASKLSHAELDEAEELDSGDPADLARALRRAPRRPARARGRRRLLRYGYPSRHRDLRRLALRRRQYLTRERGVYPSFGDPRPGTPGRSRGDVHRYVCGRASG